MTKNATDPQSRFAQVESLFKAALSTPADQREEMVRAADVSRTIQEEVLSLLAEDEDLDGGLDQPAFGGELRVAAFLEDDQETTPPESIDQYTIIRRLGRGGMGVVYEAQQESPKRTVALKVLDPGMTSKGALRRFEHEAQVLGLLQHPGIAQIFEAGTFKDNGRLQPFFAMELVDGVPLETFIETNKPSLRERLELLAKVCDAVHHAHQRGVIHRDLKPGNILITPEGDPKVLDFGIARATDADIQTTTIETNIGQLIGTVPYMSPEQASGDPKAIDTRSDVYALGVVGYELLTGRLPYDVADKMVHEAVRVIREVEPTSATTINATLRGDVETILRKALEKDKQRRYESAAALAADIRRHLSDEPITARPPSAIYQLQKFARRNRGIVTGVAAAFAVLVLGTVVSTTLAIGQHQAKKDAEHQEGIAKAEAHTAQQVAMALVSMFDLPEVFDVADAAEAGRVDISALELLDDGRERLVGELRDQPEVLDTLLETIGGAYMKLGQYSRAVLVFGDLVGVRRQLHGDQSPQVAWALHDLGMARHKQHDFDIAESLLRESLAIFESQPDPDPEAIAKVSDSLGRVVRARGRYSEGEALHREALALLAESGSTDLDLIGDAMTHLAVSLNYQDRFEEAEQWFRKSIDLTIEHHGPGHIEVAVSKGNLGLLLKDMGRYAEAKAILTEALALRRELLDPMHPLLSSNLDNLARVERRLGNLDVAEQLTREALMIQQASLREGHPSTAVTMVNLARVLDAQDRDEEALALMLEALEVYRRADLMSDPNVPTTHHNIAMMLKNAGDCDRAVPHFRAATARNAEIRGETDWRTLLDLDLLTECLETLGRDDEARAALQTLVERYAEAHGEDDERTIGAVERLNAMMR